MQARHFFSRTAMETIDLNKLTQRELLIMTHNKVNQLSERFDTIEASQADMRVSHAVLETKVKGWGGIAGAVSGAVVAVITLSLIHI